MGSIVRLSGFTSFLTILAWAFALFSTPVILAQGNNNASNPQASTVEVKDYKQEVVSLVDRAQAYIKENGKEKALAAFNDPDGPFVKNGLYVFAYDFYGVNKALATNPALVGKDLIDMKDANGKEIIKDMIAVVNRGGGWYDYKWEGHDKSSYVVKVDDTLWIGSGTYKNEAVSMVERALAYIEKNGKERAVAEFNNPKGLFVDRSLYIFAYDFNGVNKALTTHPSLIGKNLIDMKDANGREIIKDMIAVVKKGGGWYDYEWDGKQKSSYVVKVDDTLWIGCGEYTESSSRTLYLFGIALIPIAWLMVSLGVLKMPAHKATLIGLAAAAPLAFFVFKTPLLLVSTAALEGMALGFWRQDDLAAKHRRRHRSHRPGGVRRQAVEPDAEVLHLLRRVTGNPRVPGKQVLHGPLTRGPNVIDPPKTNGMTIRPIIWTTFCEAAPTTMP